MNTCTFVGRIPRDAELKDVGANKVSNFSIGSDVGFGEKKKTMWIECGMWGKRGEALNDSLKKGQQVILVGELSTREYEKDGQTKTSLSLNVQSLAFGAAPKDSENQTMTNSTTITDNDLDDEIPFQVTIDKENKVYVIPVKNAIKVCIDKTTYVIPMSKNDLAYFGWEIMKVWRESDDKVRVEDFKIYKELHKEE